MNARCELCPRRCLIRPGQSGDCHIRVNIDGKLTAVTYGFPCAMHVDPVEKKPLYHFLPGSTAFSIATAGCTLHCRNCQNWEISQATPDKVEAYEVSPAKLAELAISYHCQSIAYTYSDPAAYYEYALDGCHAAHKKGLRNILVTAAYINREPFRELCRISDAANIDLKGITDKFYREVCGGTLRPVQEALVIARECGVWLEITNLVIPSLNDSERDLRELSRWVRANLGADTPLHFSRFYPRYRMRNLPSTSDTTLRLARDIAKAEGLHHVYVGNLLNQEWSATYCVQCGKKLISRTGFHIEENHLVDGKCPQCQTQTAGVWK